MNNKVYLCGLAVLGGVLLPLGFAPFGYYWLTEVALIILLYTWFKASPKRAFWCGWIFAFLAFNFGTYWMFICFKETVLVRFAIYSIIILYIAVLALYTALSGYFLNRCYPKNNWQKFLLAFPAIFALLEWLRGWLFLGGYPWLFLGDSHVDTLLRGYASVFGVYGVSFFVAYTAGTLFYMFLERNNRKLLVKLFLWLVLIWSVGAVLTHINFTQQLPKPITVTLVQANIPLERRWDKNELWNILQYYSKKSFDNFQSDIIIWPESAIPSYSTEVNLYVESLVLAAKSHDTTIVSGVYLYAPKSQGFRNGIVAIGASEGIYYKRKLMPFGEYIPMQLIFGWLRNKLAMPNPNLLAGSKNQADLIIADVLIAPFICYELAYPYLVLDYMPQAGLLLTVSDSSWFRKGIMEQYLQVARMRSLEVGRYQLLTTNTGITAVIDPRGNVIARVEPFKATTLNAVVYSSTGSTPWVLGGKYLWIILAILGLWFAAKRQDTFSNILRRKT